LRKLIRQYPVTNEKIKKWRDKSGAHLDEKFNREENGGEEIYPHEMDEAVDLAIQIADGLHRLEGLEFTSKGHLHHDDAEQLLSSLIP
jgi:hypothetical protein